MAHLHSALQSRLLVTTLVNINQSCQEDMSGNIQPCKNTLTLLLSAKTFNLSEEFISVLTPLLRISEVSLSSAERRD